MKNIENTIKLILEEESKKKKNKNPELEKMLSSMSPEDRANAEAQMSVQDAPKFSIPTFEEIGSSMKKEEEEAKLSTGEISGVTPEQAAIGRAMAIGTAMKAAQQSGKIPVGTYPNQVKEIPYTTAVMGGAGTVDDLIKLQTDTMKAAAKAGASKEELEVASGPYSTKETLGNLGSASTDIIMAAAGGLMPKGMRTGGFRFDSRTGKLSLPTTTSSAREFSSKAREAAATKQTKDLGLDQSFGIPTKDFYATQPVFGKHQTVEPTPKGPASGLIDKYPTQSFQVSGPEDAPSVGVRSGLGMPGTRAPKAFSFGTSELGKKLGRGLVAGQLMTGTPSVSTTSQGNLSITPAVNVTPEEQATSKGGGVQSIMPGAGPQSPLRATIQTAKSIGSAVQNSNIGTELLGGKSIVKVERPQMPDYFTQIDKRGILPSFTDVLVGRHHDVRQIIGPPKPGQVEIINTSPKVDQAETINVQPEVQMSDQQRKQAVQKQIEQGQRQMPATAVDLEPSKQSKVIFKSQPWLQTINVTIPELMKQAQKLQATQQAQQETQQQAQKQVEQQVQQQTQQQIINQQVVQQQKVAEKIVKPGDTTPKLPARKNKPSSKAPIGRLPIPTSRDTSQQSSPYRGSASIGSSSIDPFTIKVSSNLAKHSGNSGVGGGIGGGDALHTGPLSTYRNERNFGVRGVPRDELPGG